MRKTDALEAIVLSALSSEAPVGARMIWRQVLRSGLDASESTVSRVLNELDARGLTVSVENKGRTLTPTGQKFVDLHASRSAVGGNSTARGSSVPRTSFSIC